MSASGAFKVRDGARVAFVTVSDWRYHVTIDAFRAEFPVCGCDGVQTPCARPLGANHQHSVINAAGKRSTSVVEWLHHCQDYCHGWHDARVRAFVVAVLRTFES